MIITHFEIPTIAKNRLIAAGFRTEQDLIGKNEAELKKLGLGAKSIYDLKIFLKYEFGIKIARPPKKKLIENPEACKTLVDHFLSGDINWGREMRSANDLLKQYPLEFLLKIPPPPKIYSLGYFFQDFGRKYLSDNAPLKLVVEEKVEKTEEAVEERVYSKVEPVKNLKTFLGL